MMLVALRHPQVRAAMASRHASYLMMLFAAQVRISVEKILKHAGEAIEVVKVPKGTGFRRWRWCGCS